MDAMSERTLERLDKIKAGPIVFKDAVVISDPCGNDLSRALAVRPMMGHRRSNGKYVEQNVFVPVISGNWYCTFAGAFGRDGWQCITMEARHEGWPDEPFSDEPSAAILSVSGICGIFDWGFYSERSSEKGWSDIIPIMEKYSRMYDSYPRGGTLEGGSFLTGVAGVGDCLCQAALIHGMQVVGIRVTFPFKPFLRGEDALKPEFRHKATMADLSGGSRRWTTRWEET